MLRVHTFIADLPAKAAVLNVKQFNGIFGCLVCKHPSKYIKSNEDGHAHTQVYLPEPVNFLFIIQIRIALFISLNLFSKVRTSVGSGIQTHV
jgi:hypothetical protein